MNEKIEAFQQWQREVRENSNNQNPEPKRPDMDWVDWADEIGKEIGDSISYEERILMRKDSKVKEDEGRRLTYRTTNLGELAGFFKTTQKVYQNLQEKTVDLIRSQMEPKKFLSGSSKSITDEFTAEEEQSPQQPSP